MAEFVLEGQPQDDEGPVFAEPWQAQAFALTVGLHQEGHFTWKEWTETIGAEFAGAVARGEPDDGTHYYDHWLTALEKLLQSKGVVAGAALASRKDQWETAYRTTPHGKPVHLNTEKTTS